MKRYIGLLLCLLLIVCYLSPTPALAMRLNTNRLYINFSTPAPNTPRDLGAGFLKKDGSNWAEWETLSNGNFKIHFQVTNHETSYYSKSSYYNQPDVVAFELYVYAEDVWGEKIYGEGVHYYLTTVKNIKPGKTVYSDYFIISDAKKIYNVYCGVKRVKYANGKVEEVSDKEVKYYCWTVKKK